MVWECNYSQTAEGKQTGLGEIQKVKYIQGFLWESTI